MSLRRITLGLCVAVAACATTPVAADVLIAGSPGTLVWMDDVVAKILATGKIEGDIDTFDTGTGTPSLALLQAYEAVLVFTDAPALDATLLGNRMADYVDRGGGVVQATFSWHTVIPLAGRWMSDGYSPLTYDSQSSGVELFIGTRHIPGHPVLANVDSFSGGSSSFHNTGVVAAGGTAIADWTNGAPLVAEMTGFNGRIIGLNFYPPSSDARDDFWLANTDGDQLLANGLVYVAGGCPTPAAVTASCTPDVAVPGGFSGSVPYNGNAPLAITIRDDGGGLATIWVPELFAGTTYVYNQALGFLGSFPSPTGIATTSGIAYDPVNGTLWYINADNLTIVEANLAGVPTGNVITCVPTVGGNGLPAGLCYNPNGDGGNGTFLYNDIIPDDIFEITRTGVLVRQIPKSCADDGAGGATFGNGIDCTCNGIEVLVGSSGFGAPERAVLIDPVTGEDAGAATELFTVTGDTFINGIVRHPTAQSTRLYVVGNATNTLFIINPADVDTEECLPPDCPADFDGSGDVGVKDLLFLLGAWGPCPKKGDCPADFDNSGDVGVKDLLFLLGAWGPCPGGGECKGQVCGEFVECAFGEPFNCFCWTLFDGTGICLQNFLCDDVVDCPDGECPPGFVCVVQSCCEVNKCVPIIDCNDGAAPQGPPTGSGLTGSGRLIEASQSAPTRPRRLDDIKQPMTPAVKGSASLSGMP